MASPIHVSIHSAYLSTANQISKWQIICSLRICLIMTSNCSYSNRWCRCCLLVSLHRLKWGRVVVYLYLVMFIRLVRWWSIWMLLVLKKGHWLVKSLIRKYSCLMKSSKRLPSASHSNGYLLNKCINNILCPNLSWRSWNQCQCHYRKLDSMANKVSSHDKVTRVVYMLGHHPAVWSVAVGIKTQPLYKASYWW